MTIAVKVDAGDYYLIKSDSDLETIIFYSDWKHLELFDIDEISEEKDK